MRQADLNRANKAYEHIAAAETVLKSIKWENLDMRQNDLRRRVYDTLTAAKWSISDFINSGKPE